MYKSRNNKITIYLENNFIVFFQALISDGLGGHRKNMIGYRQ